ncbi:hypothetical protein TIFTF001_028673 [Ficus carica]|uniref:Uncharacterized protein n=1 Tax=Ficus carica TaxID=3494 RepID=A0AA88DQC6_FICCA|nr:hypothetical protein TIFTF001_028673 [Ficus carica]
MHIVQRRTLKSLLELYEKHKHILLMNHQESDSEVFVSFQPQVLNANAGRARQPVCRSCEAFGRLIGYNMRTGTLKITSWIRLRRSLSKMEDGFEDFDATVKADWTGYK